jgi:hypothetical protein
MTRPAGSEGQSSATTIRAYRYIRRNNRSNIVEPEGRRIIEEIGRLRTERTALMKTILLAAAAAVLWRPATTARCANVHDEAGNMRQVRLICDE